MTSHKLDHDNPCPSCDANNDGTTGVTDIDAKPTPGDLSVCAYCHTMLQFDENLQSQILTPEEYVDLPLETRRELDSAVKALQEVPR